MKPSQSRRRWRFFGRWPCDRNIRVVGDAMPALDEVHPPAIERQAGTMGEPSDLTSLTIAADLHRKKPTEIFEHGTGFGVIEPPAKLLLGDRGERPRKREPIAHKRSRTFRSRG